MKKVFTLLAMSLISLATFAVDYLPTPTSGRKYYITIGSSHTGYVTAGDDGAVCTAKVASAEDQAKQTWTCTQAEDGTWTFTLNVDGQTWTLYTNSNSRLAAGTDDNVADNFKTFTLTTSDDEAYSTIQMLETVPDNGQAYANIFGGQKLGNQYGPWSVTDGGSQVYFVDPSEVEIPTWNFDFKTFNASDNSTRYFIEFARTDWRSKVQPPYGDEGLTGSNLVLSVDNDTLIADSVIVGDAAFASKIWHVVSFDAESHAIKLVNENGQYITYKDFETPLVSGNKLFNWNEATSSWVRTNQSGGGEMKAGYMTTTNPDETTLYVFKSNYGSENYAIGDTDDSSSKNFINAWGNIGYHHPMGKWTADDQNCALKFVPIIEVLSADQIPSVPTTGIKTITPATKAADSTVYTVDGRVAGKSLKGLAKGLYIVNGKKVVK